MLVGQWYKFADVSAFNRFKESCYSNEQIATFILTHKYFKVITIDEDTGAVVSARTIDGTVTDDLHFHFSIKAEEYEFFVPAQVEWKEHEFYKLVDPIGFRNASAINSHIADTIKDKVFVVKKTDSIFDNARVLSLYVRNDDGYGEEFKCTITLRELVFFVRCRRDGTILDDYRDFHFPSFDEMNEANEKEVENNPIIEVNGKITIVVDDEQSRLFAIKALEGIRFANV